MARLHGLKKPHELRELLTRDHTLNGGILFGIDGYIIEIQARAIKVNSRPGSWSSAASISGMARGEPEHIDEAAEYVVGGMLREAFA